MRSTKLSAGKAELVTALLDKGARPDLKDETGAAPVHLAVVSGTM